MFKLGFINKFFWLLNLIASATLLISYLVIIINPIDFWPIAYLGLVFPFLLLLNLFFILYWLFQKKIHLLLSLISLIAGLNYALRIFQISLPQKNKSDVSESFKMMSYNVKIFDYYNWKRNVESREKIFSVIKNENPHIICFQEFFSSDEYPFKNIDSMMELLSFKDYYFETIIMVRETERFGLATFSKFPIVNKGKIRYARNSYNGCIYTDINMNGNIIRIYNVHLQSIKFDYENYDYIKSKEVDIEESRKIMGKLKRAFKKRASQSIKIANHIKNTSYPVFVCGDFNDTPISFAYQTIIQSKDLMDAFIEKGWGIGQTYAGPFPLLRIDYILHDKNIEIINYATVKNSYSDHYPVTANFVIRNDTAD